MKISKERQLFDNAAERGAVLCGLSESGWVLQEINRDYDNTYGRRR